MAIPTADQARPLVPEVQAEFIVALTPKAKAVVKIPVVAVAGVFTHRLITKTTITAAGVTGRAVQLAAAKTATAIAVADLPQRRKTQALSIA